MPSVLTSRKSIRYSIFAGAIATAIFAEAKAFANGVPIELNGDNFYNEISSMVNGVAVGLSGNYVLTDDVDVSSAPGVTVFSGIFTGVLNGFREGGNYIIFGLSKPLFDQIGDGDGDGGVVKNLNLETVADGIGVQGSGALANTLDAGGRVENVTVTGNVTGGYEIADIGGLVGRAEGTITGSTMNGDVDGHWRVGGLVGTLTEFGTITDSHTTGDVTGVGDRVGGLVGRSDGNITDSTATGNVEGRWEIGGLVGYSDGFITRSHTTGAVSGEDRVGGLVGQSDGDITFSSAKGGVSSTAIDAIGFGNHGPLAEDDRHGIGGLVGYNTGNITNTFTGEADSDSPIPSGGVSGLINVGGLVGFSSGNISNSRASGNVNESWSCAYNPDEPVCIEYVGGLVGYSTGVIESSWASGYVSGENYIGGLVGYSTGDIESSFAEGEVNGTDYVGGLVGYSTGDITVSEASGDVGGQRYIGGLVGYSEGDITDSNATTNVYGFTYSGGLVGYSEGNITNSHATGEEVVSDGQGGRGDYIGGLVGYSEGVIANSSASGAVTGGENVGGLVGSIFQGLPWSYEYSDLPTLRSFRPNPDNGEINLVQGDFYIWDGDDWRKIFHISGSYAEGDVTGESYVGGLVGYSEGNITNSYATGVVTGSGEYIGGFVGDAYRKIEDSFATGDVTGTGLSEDEHGIGGFAGYLGGYLSNVHAEGNVYGFYQVGGLVGSTGAVTTITNSYATGDVTGRYEIGGLVGKLDDYHVITNSYATGDVTGDDEVGGLVGQLNVGASVSHSYSTGDVTGNLTEGDGGDVGGLVGIAYGIISNSYATGDVSGIYDVGGLVGDLNDDGEIRNSFATGDVTATGFNGDWVSGWGGLVGEFAGIIENSYATGNVFADYHAGSLVGFIFYADPEDEDYLATITNSFATGVVSRGTGSVVFAPEERCIPDCWADEFERFDVNFSEWASAFGGFVGCQSSENVGDSVIDVSCSVDELTQTTPQAPSIVSVVNAGGTPAFEIVACKNNGFPLISLLSASYSNTCPPNPTPASLSVALASAVNLNPKFSLLESTTLRLLLYLAGDNSIRITVEDFVVLGATGVNSKNLPVLLKLLKNVDLLTLDLNTINKNVKIANDLLKKQKKK